MKNICVPLPWPTVQAAYHKTGLMVGLTAIAGAPGSYKTALALAVAANLAKHGGVDVVLSSRDHPREALDATWRSLAGPHEKAILRGHHAMIDPVVLAATALCYDARLVVVDDVRHHELVALHELGWRYDVAVLATLHVSPDMGNLMKRVPSYRILHASSPTHRQVTVTVRGDKQVRLMVDRLGGRITER